MNSEEEWYNSLFHSRSGSSKHWKYEVFCSM